MNPPQRFFFSWKLTLKATAFGALSFLFVCLESGAATVTRGPYLQTGTPTSVIVRWRTDVATDSSVRFGTASTSLSGNVSDSTSTTEHIINVTNLSPDTIYFYSVGTTGGALASGTNYFFRTSPLPGSGRPFRVWVLGDFGFTNANAIPVRNAYYTYTGSRYTDLWLMLGDNAYHNGGDEVWQVGVFNTYSNLLRQTVVWSTIGNQETFNSTTLAPSVYLQVFSFPTNAEAGGVASGTERYYSFDYGNVHFVCLDSMSSSRAAGSPMLTWLEADLAATTNEWIIAFWHHPPYSKGSNDSDVKTEQIQMRMNALPILEAHGVDLVLGGHSHSYERSLLIDGHYGLSSTFTTNFVKNGGDGRIGGNGAYFKTAVGPDGHKGAVYAVAGSGAALGGGNLNHPVMYYSANNYGSMVLDFHGNRLDAQFLRDTGEIDDYFTLIKVDVTPPNIVCPTNQILECVASSGQPVFFNVAANDLRDGSVPVTCSPQSGSLFPLGSTLVSCSASDTSGNGTNCSFEVLLIGDTTPPNIVCPENQIQECVALEGESVFFTATAIDLCDGSVPVSCSPPSGSVFRLGATPVTCTASDQSGNRTNCSFVVLLIGTQCDGEYHLTTSTSSAGRVDANPFLEPYPCGTCVQLTAVPAGGWKFLGWLGDLSGTNQVTNITVTANKCVTAVFAARVLLAASGNGVAKLDPPGDLFPFNSLVRLLALPESGYYFDHWTNAVTNTANPVTLQITRSTSSVAAVFLPLPTGRFALTVTAEGNGRVSGQNTGLENLYPTGSNVMLRAISEAGQDFLGWDGDLTGTNNPATVAMNASRTIIARFTKRPSVQIVQCSGKLADQIVRLLVKGRLLESYVIEASPGLSDRTVWKTVAFATNTLGAAQYNDPLAPGTLQRFYRARLQP